MARTTAIFRVFLIVVSLQLVASIVANAQCEYRSEQFLEQLSTSDSLRHRSGKHSAFARAKFQCVCDHTCRSRCTPSWDSKRCTERGLLTAAVIHVPRVKERLTSGTKANAVSGSGADCGAGYGCFIQECRPGSCGSFPINVAVQPVGVGLSTKFGTTRVPVWDGQLDLPFECDRCFTSRAVTDDLRNSGQEYIPADDGGYGTGSGSVYRTCWWECESWMDSAGRYQEYCEVKECLIF